MRKLCLIISGGEFYKIPDELRAADFIIACDRGWRHAARLGLTPDLIIGDFDSAPPPEAKRPKKPWRKAFTGSSWCPRFRSW